MITLTMSAPGKNALGIDSMGAITKTLRDAKGEPVFVTGAGDAFSAGLNLKEVASFDPKGMLHFLEVLEEMVDVLYNYPGPTIAWVNGHAIAGGCVVALACDLRFVKIDPSIRIGLNEVPLGLQFPPKTWRMVRHRLPAHTIDRMILEGALFAPADARRLGLVDEVLENEEQARAHAERVASAPRDAYAAAKKSLRAGVLDITADEKKRFLDVAIPSWTSPELKAKLAAVLKK